MAKRLQEIELGEKVANLVLIVRTKHLKRAVELRRLLRNMGG